LWSPAKTSALSAKTQIRWLALARLRLLAGDAVTRRPGIKAIGCAAALA
jgi:hypothetical protein